MANFIQQLTLGENTYDFHDSEFILDNRTAAGAALTGVSKAPALFDGMQITYWLNYAAGTNATLNLTLADGTKTGAIPVYYSGTTRLTTHYGAGNAIRMVYRENAYSAGTARGAGWWCDANYYSDTNYDIFGASLKVDTAIYQYSLCALTGTTGTIAKQKNTKEAGTYWKVNSFTTSGGTGTSKKATTKGFIPYQILYNTSSSSYTTAGGASSTLSQGGSGLDLRYSVNGSTSSPSGIGVAGAPFFLVGTIGSDGLFYLLGNGATKEWWTCGIPTTPQTDYVYWFAGTMYSVYQLRLSDRNWFLRWSGTGEGAHLIQYETWWEVAEAVHAQSADSVPWTGVTGKPDTFTPTIGNTSTTAAAGNHTHGYISNDGAITDSVATTPASGDKIVVTDSSDSNKVKGAITIGSDDGKFLKHDGTWDTPNSGPDTPDAPSTDGTYSLSVSNGTPSWTAVAPSGLQPPSSNGHYMLGINGSSVTWESSPDLYAIEQLSGTSGILKKTAANTWALDTTTYLASSAISDWAKASTKPSYSLSEIDGTQDLRKIEALADSSTGFLKKTAANTWALDSTTYATSSDISSAINALDGSITGSAAANKTLTAFSQTNGIVTAEFGDISITKSQVSDFPSSMPASDVSAWAKASTKPSYALSELTGASDVQAIEALTGTSGLLKKTAADTWSLDTTSYLPTTGGNVTGDITLLKQVASGAPGDSYALIFQRGTLTDSYNDWMIIDSGGYLYFRERGSGSTAWTNRVTFNTSGNVSAASFSGSGASLTSLNASNLSSGTVPVARIPDLSSTYIPTSQKGTASGVATLDTNSKVPIVQSNYLYGKCSTAGSTAAKTVTIAGYDESTIANMEGVTVFVAFKNVSTASNPTLNVSGAGAHPIVTGTYDDPVAIGKFTNGLHAFTLVKAMDNSYYWWINEGRDTVPEAPTSVGTYLLTINSSGNVSWSTFTPPTAATVGTLTLNASGWSGNGPYSHSVTISGTTANSKIDLQPDSTVLAQMTTDGTTAIYIENNNGTLTAWAMGAAPTASLTIQYTKTEVA